MKVTKAKSPDRFLSLDEKASGLRRQLLIDIWPADLNGRRVAQGIMHYAYGTITIDGEKFRFRIESQDRADVLARLHDTLAMATKSSVQVGTRTNWVYLEDSLPSPVA